MKYTFKLDSQGAYNVKIRYATESSDGKFSLSIDDEKITDPFIMIEPGNENILKVGKRRFLKIK